MGPAHVLSGVGPSTVSGDSASPSWRSPFWPNTHGTRPDTDHVAAAPSADGNQSAELLSHEPHSPADAPPARN